jgi:HSP20 family protein
MVHFETIVPGATPTRRPLQSVTRATFVARRLQPIRSVEPQPYESGAMEENKIMTLIRWNPGVQRDLVRVHDEMDRLFDQFLGRFPDRTGLAQYAPPVDVEETPEGYVVKADLPGFDQKNIKVNVTGDTLTIRGERQQTSARKDGSLHRTERLFGSFERTFVLGAPVRSDQIQATYRDGVLEVRVPKAEEARSREIEVQVA